MIPNICAQIASVLLSNGVTIIKKLRQLSELLTLSYELKLRASFPLYLPLVRAVT